MSLEARPRDFGTDVLLDPTLSVSRPRRLPGEDHGHLLAAFASSGLAAAALVVPGGPVRLAMLFPFILIGPGSALLSYVRVSSVLVSWALAVTASLTVIG